MQQETEPQEPAAAEIAEVNGTKYSALQAAIDAAPNSATVKLLTDATEDVTIAAGKNVTLDLDGKTLTNTNAGKATLTIAKDATATVKNGSIVGGTGFYTIQNNGTTTLEDATATAGNTGSSMIDNYGTLAINSGAYTGGLDTVKNEPNAKLTITGGAFTLTKGNSGGFTGVVFNYGELTISGGKFIQSDKSAPYGQAQVIHTDKSGSTVPSTVITGGTFKNLCSKTTAWTVRATNAVAGATKVSGGAFNKSVKDDYCAEGFIPTSTKDADGNYGVKEGHYVAQVGSKKYETLADAIRLAAKGKTIQLLTDTTENITIAENKQIKLDLNGHTLNGGTGTAKAAILNKGNVTITDTSAGKTGTIKRDDQGIEGETSYYVIDNNGTMVIDQANVVNNSGIKGSSLIRNGGVDAVSSLTINGGTFEQQNFIAVKNDGNGELTINGGTLTSKQAVVQNWNKAKILGGNLTGGYLWTDSYTEAGTIGETVIGGDAQFTGTIYMDVTSPNPSTLKIEGGSLNVTSWKVTDAAAKANSTIAVSGGTFTAEVPAAYCAEGFTCVANSDGTYGVAVAIAQIGDKSYASLQSAIDDAADGATVKLLANASEDVTINKDKNLTLDLNGFKLTNVKDHTITNNGTLTITDSSEAKSGTVDNLTHAKAPVENNQGATCTIAGGNFTRSKEAGESSTNSGGNSYYYIENIGTMTIGGDVRVSSKGHFSSLVHNGWYDGSKNTAMTNAVMTIDSGSFAGGINTIKNDDYGEITINGGDFKNATQHPLFNVNVATVNGGTFESSTNSAVYTKAYDDSADKGTTTINGGTFKSAAGKSDFLVDNKTHESTVVVSGGTFSDEVPAKCRAEGFICVKNSNGTYGVAKQGVVVEPSEENRNSGSVSTSGVTVERDEQQKVAESAAKAAEEVKNVEVKDGATEAKIGDVTVDVKDAEKAKDVMKVAEKANEENTSVNVQLVVKAAPAAKANPLIEAAAENATVVPFELSVDMVTEVKDSDNKVIATASVPVKVAAKPIKVTYNVAPSSIKGKKVMIARVHDKKVDLIDPISVNEDTGDVTFETAKFSDYALRVTEVNQSYDLANYTNEDGSRKAINNADFNVSDEYAFAGWYKDAKFTQPCASKETKGTVYPKFVKISDNIQYMGGSLRMDGPAASESTSLRFGYITSVPDGAKYIDSWWTWNDGANDRKPVKADKRVLFENGKALANLVLTGVPSNSYSTTVHVTEHLKYQTVDGTMVEVAEASSHQHSVATVAQAILDNPGASSSEQKYAQQILDTIK